MHEAWLNHVTDCVTLESWASTTLLNSGIMGFGKHVRFALKKANQLVRLFESFNV
jgi:flagellar assembly factor FliW